jgi:hypothetical protein
MKAYKTPSAPRNADKGLDPNDGRFARALKRNLSRGRVGKEMIEVRTGSFPERLRARNVHLLPVATIARLTKTAA